MMWIFFWIIGKIPATFWMILSIAGAVLFVLSGVLGRLPAFKTYSWALKPLSVLIMFIGVYMYGGASINDHYQKMIAEYEQKIKVAEQQSAAINTVIEDRVVTQTQVIRDTQVLYQDRIVEIAPEIDGQCKVNPEAIRIHNDAASDPLKSFRNSVNRAAGDKK